MKIKMKKKKKPLHYKLELKCKIKNNKTFNLISSQAHNLKTKLF
jgi:hypothetical protein